MSVAERTEIFIDLRCPIGPRALLGKVIAQGGTARRTEDNLLELACRDCTRRVRQSNPAILHLVHRFNVLGELVESVATERD